MSKRWLLCGGERVRSSCCSRPFLVLTDGGSSILPITPECCRKSVAEKRADVGRKLTRTYEVVDGVKVARFSPVALAAKDGAA